MEASDQPAMPVLADRWTVAKQVAKEAARAAVDASSPRARPVPRSPRQISPDWLGGKMGLRRGAIRSIEVIDEAHGTAARARLVLDRTDLSLPESVFAKTTPTKVVERLFHNTFGLGEREARLYDKFGHDGALHMPVVHATHWERRTGRSVIVMEDLAARGAVFGDVRTSCTSDEAALMARALAEIHRGFWSSQRFVSDLRWLTPPANRSLTFGLLANPLVSRLRGRAAELVPVTVRRQAAILHQRPEQVAVALRSLPLTLLHGDTHRGNLAFEADRVTLYDWQVAGQGPALQDLVYFCVTSLDPDTRAKEERDLVALYCDALTTGAGAPVLGVEDAWDQYCVLATRAYVAGAVTAAMGSRLQEPDIAYSGLERAVRAVQDLDSFDRLRRLLD